METTILITYMST